MNQLEIHETTRDYSQSQQIHNRLRGEKTEQDRQNKSPPQ